MQRIGKKEWILWAILTGILVLVTLSVGRVRAIVDRGTFESVEASQGGNDGTVVRMMKDDGTYNFIWTSVNRKAKHRTVMYTIGYEISMLKSKPNGEPVDPNSPEYFGYNGDTSCGPQGGRDPHYYVNNERVSFVLNRQFADNGPGKDSGEYLTVDEGSRDEDRAGKDRTQRVYVFRFSQNVLEAGINRTGNAEWRQQWENFINHGSYFAFAIDSIVGTSDNDGIGVAGVVGIAKADNGLTDRKGNKIIDPATGRPYDDEALSKTEAIYDAMYLSREWGYTLDGYPTSIKYSGFYHWSPADNARLYAKNVRKSEFLQKDNYGSAKDYPPMATWKNWSNINQYALTTAILDGAYKKYYANSGNYVPPTPPDKREGTITTSNETETVILTKQKDSTKNIQIGLKDDQSGDQNCAPETYTSNNDNTNTFDIGDAIPTTESYTNAVEDSKWYGSVPIHKVTVKTTFKVPYKVYWTQGYDVNTTAPTELNGNDTTWQQSTAHITGDHSYLTYATYTKTDVFYQVSYVNLYQLVSSTITNDSAGGTGGSGATVNYPFNIEVPYTCTINGASASKQNDKSPEIASQSLNDLLKTNYINFRPGYSQASLDALKYEHTLRLPGEYATTPTGEISKAVQNDLSKIAEPIFTTKNDTFAVANHVYLDESGIKDGLDKLFSPTTSQLHEMVETDPFFEKSTADHLMTIGKDVKNGKYYTDLSTTYQRFITDDSTRTFSILDRKYFYDDTKNKLAIHPGNIPNTTTPYTHNEPVVVFSPVIAPISVSGSDATQLTNKTGEHHGLAQMRLDGTYRINFDWNDYYQEKGYDRAHASGWANYVKKKYLSFPFSVYVKSETLADGTVKQIDKYYEPDSDANTEKSAGSGYTGWVAFDDTTTSVDIYIPTWAREGIYGGSMVNITTNDFYNTNNRPIAVRAEANNVPEDLSLQGEWTANTNGKSDSNYVATFDLPVEISGWLYGFTVDAVRTSKNFAPIDWKDEWGLNVYNFVTASKDTNKTEAEKRYGTKNRFGDRIGLNTIADDVRKSVRFIYDGTLTNQWDTRNTLPMASGKSTNSDIGGYLDPGNTIAFTIKTIANLADLNDSVKITASYRYYDLNGNENDNIDIWSKGNDGTLVRMGSKKDLTKEVTKDTLYADDGACWRENCYFGNADGELGYYNTFMQTSNYDAKTADDDTFARTKKGKGYSVGQVTINPNMRLITGNEEELLDNAKNPSTTANRYTVSNRTGFWNLSKSEYGWAEGDTSYNAPNNGYDFKNSMQTWYGKYWVPEKIYICDKGAAEHILKTEGELSDDTPIWKKNGYLVLNFQIKTYDKDGNEHLEYVTPRGVNMWKNEEGDAPQTFSIDTPLKAGAKITKKDGDVAIINLGRGNQIPEQTDYETGLLYLN